MAVNVSMNFNNHRPVTSGSNGISYEWRPSSWRADFSLTSVRTNARIRGLLRTEVRAPESQERLHHSELRG